MRLIKTLLRPPIPKASNKDPQASFHLKEEQAPLSPLSKAYPAPQKTSAQKTSANQNATQNPKKSVPTFYLLVRTDLPCEQIAVQAIHAALESFRSICLGQLCCLVGDTEHPHVVLCGVESEEMLLQECASMASKGINLTEWREPDKNNELTAVASGIVTDRKPFRHWKLLNFSRIGDSSSKEAKIALRNPTQAIKQRSLIKKPLKGTKTAL